MSLVVGILGSPRRGGNTDLLLDQCLAGAEESGARVSKIALRDLAIAPCRGCNRCLASGECAVADDMRDVHRALLEADAVVVASPIYFSGPTCLTKCMIDRCQCLWARERLLGMRSGHQRRGAMILVGGDPKAVFRNAQSEIRALFAGIGISFQAELLVAGVEGLGEVLGRPQDLRRARELGRGLAAPGP